MRPINEDSWHFQEMKYDTFKKFIVSNINMLLIKRKKEKRKNKNHSILRYLLFFLNEINK